MLGSSDGAALDGRCHEGAAGEVVGHVLALEGLHVAAADDAGCEGPGGVEEELVDQADLAREDYGDERAGIEVGLGDGVELVEDVEAEEMGLVDEEDETCFLPAMSKRRERTKASILAMELDAGGSPGAMHIWRSSSMREPEVATSEMTRYREGWSRPAAARREVLLPEPTSPVITVDRPFWTA